SATGAWPPSGRSSVPTGRRSVTRLRSPAPEPLPVRGRRARGLRGAFVLALAFVLPLPVAALRRPSPAPDLRGAAEVFFTPLGPLRRSATAHRPDAGV